jgi:hypothetical protein
MALACAVKGISSSTIKSLVPISANLTEAKLPTLQPRAVIFELTF